MVVNLFLHFLELVNLNFLVSSSPFPSFRKSERKKREKMKKQRTISNFCLFHGSSMIELRRDGEEQDRVNKNSQVFFLSI